MGKKKIIFITSAHLAHDDRIFYHMALSLVALGFEVQISAGSEFLETREKGVDFKCFDGNSHSKQKKVEKFQELLSEFTPDIVISSEPLPLYAASQYKKNTNNKVKVIYDITEWYPSKKNLIQYSGAGKFFFFFKLLLFNYFAASKADGFIFGERYKQVLYRMIFPFKPYEYVTYYPHLKYINYTPSKLSPGKIVLGYTGKISEEKGFKNFISTVKSLSRQRNELKIFVKIVGWFADKNDEIEAHNLLNELEPSIQFQFLGRQSFPELSNELADINVFFDLRKIDFENNHCLPIKVFYYAACGRPVVYSGLKALKKEVEVDPFGFLVDPEEHETIAAKLIKYLDEPHLYDEHCKNARKWAENNYNWERIEKGFIDFINAF